MIRRFRLLAALLACAACAPWTAFADSPHNVILFIPDGLRAGIVDAATAPTFARLRDEGVNFKNSHSIFPTFTTANASAFATGHYFGDTGDFSNSIYTEFPVQAANGSVTPFLELDPVLKEVNQRFGGNYLNEDSIVTAARVRGYSTATIGKLGPVAIFDVKGLEGEGSLIVDDSTGRDGGIPIPAEWLEAFKAAKLKPEAPGRGDNGKAGTSTVAGTLVPNFAQQQFFLEVALRVVLPKFKAANKPFVLVYWSRDPDGTQHNHGDSLNSLTPGINGPTSLAAIRTADMALASLEQGLKSLGLADTTNIVVSADHGFSTVSKASATSLAVKQNFADVNANELPPGFVAIDLANALSAGGEALSVFDPDVANSKVDWREGLHSSHGNALIGTDPQAPKVVIAANGGSDLVYIPKAIPEAEGKRLVEKIVQTLLNQDYVSGLFVDTRRFGEQPGALSIEHIRMQGAARPPMPAMVVNFKSFTTGKCKIQTNCVAEVSDTRAQPGQGMHGSFSRADTWNFMAARGPDFRKRFANPLPASNADIAMTIARVLQLDIPRQGSLVGRVLEESLQSHAKARLPGFKRQVIRSEPAANGLRTIMQQQTVGDTVYFDAAGFPGRTVGLTAK
jgi:hypothetical protein